MVHTARYLLLWMGREIWASDVVAIQDEVEGLVKEPRADVEVDVWLDCPGGDAHAAYRLALVLRHAAGRVRVAVADAAKGAAMLLVVAADEVHVAPGGELGPLDTAMPVTAGGDVSGDTETDDGEAPHDGHGSALAIAREIDDLGRGAAAVLARTSMLLRRHGLTRREAVDPASRFAARFTSPLVRQVDPRMVANARRELAAVRRYAGALLTDSMRPRRAAALAAALVDDYPGASFVLTGDDARTLGLPVRPLADYDLLDGLRTTHRIVERDEPWCWFYAADELLQQLDGDTR